MKKTLVLVTLLAVAFAQTCDLTTQFAYQGKCLEKSCINDKLYRIKLIPLDPNIDTNIGKLSTGITYSAAAIQLNGSTAYQVTLLYGDIATDQITSDPVNCIDYRIYQNVNSFDVNPTRLFSATEGAVPTWPINSYTYNTTLSAAQIQFNVTQAELDSRQCIAFTYSDQTQWECFFELAFVIEGVTQASYYFSFTVTVNAAVRAGNVPAVDFVKIIEVERCAGQSYCSVSVTVPTSLWFCSDSTCSNIALTPFFLLYINRDFYMLHRIDDAAFAASWFIEDVTLTFQSFNFQLSLKETEFNVTLRVVGHNIYLLHVPIVATDVLITAFGSLRQQGATIINETTSAAAIRTGQVLSAADEAAAIAALAAARAAAAAKILAEKQAAIQAKIAAQAAADAIAQAAYDAKVKADAAAHALAIAQAKAAAEAAAKAAAEQAAAIQALADAKAAAAAQAAADQAAAQAAAASQAQAAAQAAAQASAQAAAAYAADQAAYPAADHAAAGQAAGQAAGAAQHANQKAGSALGATIGDAAAVSGDAAALITSAISNSGACDLVNNFLYQNQCVPKSCLLNKLSRIILTPLDEFTTNIGKLSLGIVYTATVVHTDAAGYGYHVQILYGDQQNNQIVADPINCIDWRVYQVANAYDIDNTRVGVTGDGSVPLYPVSSYQFNAASSAGQIDFNVTQADLDNQKCIKLAGTGKVQWECFFELAFIVKNITQVSYYFSIIVVVDTTINTASPPAVNFVKIIQIERCPASNADGNVCQVEVSIASDLLFCQDATCVNIKNTPYFLLYLNRVFWMIHRIDDAAFNTSWYINNVTLNYQAFGFQLTLAQTEYTELKHNVGFNIYELHVPIVSPQVLITASGILSQTARRMLQASSGSVPVTHVSTDLGAVLAPPSSMISASVASASASEHSSNAYLISAGLAVLAAIAY